MVFKDCKTTVNINLARAPISKENTRLNQRPNCKYQIIQISMGNLAWKVANFKRTPYETIKGKKTWKNMNYIHVHQMMSMYCYNRHLWNNSAWVLRENSFLTRSFHRLGSLVEATDLSRSRGRPELRWEKSRVSWKKRLVFYIFVQWSM